MRLVKYCIIHSQMMLYRKLVIAGGLGTRSGIGLSSLLILGLKMDGIRGYGRVDEQLRLCVIMIGKNITDILRMVVWPAWMEMMDLFMGMPADVE